MPKCLPYSHFICAKILKVGRYSARDGRVCRKQTLPSLCSSAEAGSVKGADTLCWAFYVTGCSN